MKTINWEEFTQVELRVGTIIECDDFPKARNPSYLLQIDFGNEIGIRKSSAQITYHYDKQELIGRQIVGVVNFPPKQIGPVMSHCLVTGFYDKNNQVILAVPDKSIHNGAKLG